MTTLVPRPARVAWLVLVAVTVVSWWLGSGHGLDRRAAGTVVLLLGVGKAALVASEFMELRSAPRGLQLAMAALLGGAGAALVAIFLL